MKRSHVAIPIASIALASLLAACSSGTTGMLPANPQTHNLSPSSNRDMGSASSLGSMGAASASASTAGTQATPAPTKQAAPTFARGAFGGTGYERQCTVGGVIIACVPSNPAPGDPGSGGGGGGGCNPSGFIATQMNPLDRVGPNPCGGSGGGGGGGGSPCSKTSIKGCIGLPRANNPLGLAGLIAEVQQAVGSSDLQYMSSTAADDIINANVINGPYATPMFSTATSVASTTADSAMQSVFNGAQMLVRLSTNSTSAESGNFLTTLGSLQNADGSMMTAEQAASAAGLGSAPTYVGINMQLPMGAQTLMGDVAGGNASAVSGSVGGAVQVYTVGQAATAAGDSAFAGGEASMTWDAFVSDAAAFLAPVGLHDPRNGGKR